MVQYDLKSYFGKLSREVAWVIIAAFGHVNSLPRKFKAQGIDVAKAKAESRYIA